MQPTDTIERVLPPWKLRGRGWILLYRFEREFITDNGLLPGHLDGHYRGGIGAVMLVDYSTSPVGPYRELLFIPGVFRHGRRYHAIHTIYVSTAASVVNGRENWGIPKQLADFEIHDADDQTQQWRVSVEGSPIFSATLESGVLRFPVNTLFNPFPVRLLQQHADGRLLSVLPRAAGVISPTAKLHELTANGHDFPNVSGIKPLGVVEAVNIRLTFPLPLEID